MFFDDTYQKFKKTQQPMLTEFHPIETGMWNRIGQPVYERVGGLVEPLIKQKILLYYELFIGDMEPLS
jgi:hypothetical protein